MAKGVKTGGRKPGSRNKVTSDIKELAQKFAPDAMKELARLATQDRAFDDAVRRRADSPPGRGTVGMCQPKCRNRQGHIVLG